MPSHKQAHVPALSPLRACVSAPSICSSPIVPLASIEHSCSVRVCSVWLQVLLVPLAQEGSSAPEAAL